MSLMGDRWNEMLASKKLSAFLGQNRKADSQSVFWDKTERQIRSQFGDVRCSMEEVALSFGTIKKRQGTVAYRGRACEREPRLVQHQVAVRPYSISGDLLPSRCF